MSQTFAILPARWQSTRFPGKPLVSILGKPLIQHVWERCLEAKRIDHLLVATDDERIFSAAQAFGAEVIMTSSHHATGTDRLAELAPNLPEGARILNVQGDEPLIHPPLLDEIALTLELHAEIDFVTAASPFASEAEAQDPNRVKVVTNFNGDALYFSRSLIPFQRDTSNPLHPSGLGDSSHPYDSLNSPHFTQNTVTQPQRWHHLGVYGYQRSFLLKWATWTPTPLEEAEKLEQLRALEYGARIRVLPTIHRSLGVDVPADVPVLEKALREQGGLS